VRGAARRQRRQADRTGARPGGATDRGGIGLFLVDAKANGVTRRGYPTQDGMRAADVTLSAVRVGPEAVLAGPTRAWPCWSAWSTRRSPRFRGGGRRHGGLHELTVEYLKTRKQFGVPIGSFQVLQHRAVDMLTALEQARSMAYYATMMAAETDASERRKAMSAAKVQIGAARRASSGRTAIPAARPAFGVDHGVTTRPASTIKRLTMIDVAFWRCGHHLRPATHQAGGLS
jgi:alkylation response protein AidB-like acyl-CoA dehydrogenase